MNTADNQIGLGLALSSSAFIGSSFIVKKKGLLRARSSGHGAGELACIISVMFIERGWRLCISSRVALVDRAFYKLVFARIDLISK
jgi:hypothetical protein